MTKGNHYVEIHTESGAIDVSFSDEPERNVPDPQDSLLVGITESNLRRTIVYLNRAQVAQLIRALQLAHSNWNADWNDVWSAER